MTIRPLIIGHRGASALAPENTLAAFRRALEDGADGIEFDVRLARDQVPVVIHDASLSRTAQVDRLVSELTSEELQQLDAGSWFARALPTSAVSFSNEKIPTLSELFEFFAKNKGLMYLEMKADNDGEGDILPAEVVRNVQNHSVLNRVVVESFNLSSIKKIKRIDERIRTAALFEPKLTRPISTLKRLRMIDLALDCGADEIALHHSLVSSRLVEKAQRAGLATVVWTVDKPAWLERAELLGISALITNNPGNLVRYRNSTQANANRSR
jgi:glycerophosphoryl diester phosphodiesterase